MPRELPIGRLRVVAAAVLLALALLVGARKLLSAGTAASVPLPPVGTGATSTAPARPALRVVVDVVGAVRRPGLYRFAQGARVADAVARAGGATRHAALAQVNLAAPLSDGEQVVVPARGSPGSAGRGADPSAPSGPLDLNSATLEQLDALPGVGPVTAQKILDYRQQHGAFTSLAELDAIPGIGPARIDQLRGLVVP
jgi:competence protein ComEA